MKGKNFIDRIFDIGRERAASVHADTECGNGSHVTLCYGSRFMIVKGRRKDIGPGLFSAVIRQPGLDRSDVRQR